MIPEVGQSLLNFLQAVSAFNYQVISLILRAALETWKALVTVGGAFLQACSQMIYHLISAGQEILGVCQTFLELAKALVMLVVRLLIVLFCGLESVGAWIGSVISVCIRTIYSGVKAVVGYIGISGSDVKLYISSGAQTTGQVMRDTGSASLRYLYYYYVIAFKATAQFLLSCQSGLLSVCDVIKRNAVTAVEQVGNTGRFLYTYTTTNIPLDVYAWLLGIVGIFFILRCIGHYLSKRGLTFPSFRHVSNETIITLDDSDIDIIESDVDDFGGEESELEIIEEEVDTSLGSDSSGSGSNSDELEDDDDDDDDDDDVLEYEVGTDSDSEEVEGDDEDEENNPNRINVQLPDRASTYSLRSRATPTLEDTKGANKMSPSQLQRVLDRERDRRACVVCQDAVKCVLVLPCRHMCLCVDCAHEIASSRIRQRRICPLCRARIETIMNVYL